MKVKLVRPSEDYPMAWVHVDLKTDLNGKALTDILNAHRYTLLANWSVHTKNGVSEFRAPVLLEDEHTKPRGRRRR
ncbi:hypothetical protein SEA_LIBERTYBELL_37 [Streptomyces phage LibertyBell]|nr:hypothetical protein SEA_LIBERTYBELL_37 [Streptomyces phage LibertyBell]